MEIKAILLDLDETLMPEHTIDTETLKVACQFAQQKKQIDPQQMQTAIVCESARLWRDSPVPDYCNSIGISHIEGLWGNFLGDDPHLILLREWIPEYQWNSWMNALVEQGIDDRNFTARLIKTFKNERCPRHRLYDDTIPNLKTLAENYRLAIVTNGSPFIQADKIIKTGLSDYVDTFIISGKIGVGKPDPRPFQVAMTQLGVEPFAAVMVGDSIESDIIGAKELGIKSIWINREGIRHRDSHLADAEIQSLDQLVSKL